VDVPSGGEMLHQGHPRNQRGDQLDGRIEADQHVADLPPRLDVPVSLNDLVQGIPSIDDRLERSGREHLLEIPHQLLGAKGLSADHVILLGFDPVNMGLASPQLFFVAMTRARRSLHLVMARKARGADRPHDFLKDVPEEHCDHLIRKAKETITYTTRAEFIDRLRRWAWGAKFGSARPR
jgi:hypothetical protein